MKPLDSDIGQRRRGTGRPASETTPLMVAMGAVTTLLLHGAVIGLIVWGTLSGGRDIEEKIEPKMLEFEQVDLLALGEEKPPNQLPRLANPALPEKQEDAVNLAKKDEPPKPVEKKEEPEKTQKEERKKLLNDAFQDLHNPNRPTNTDIPEGHAEGVVGGTVSDAAMANLMGTFSAKLIGELSKFWRIPNTVPDDEIARLVDKVIVYVRLSPQGHVVSYRFKRTSGNPQFDGSIERVLKRFTVQGGRKLPTPTDPRVKEAVLEHGLDLKEWQYTGR